MVRVKNDPHIDAAHTVEVVDPPGAFKPVKNLFDPFGCLHKGCPLHDGDEFHAAISVDVGAQFFREVVRHLVEEHSAVFIAEGIVEGLEIFNIHFDESALRLGGGLDGFTHFFDAQRTVGGITSNKIRSCRGRIFLFAKKHRITHLSVVSRIVQRIYRSSSGPSSETAALHPKRPAPRARKRSISERVRIPPDALIFSG